jgi:HEAT repeat protein
MSFLDTLIDQAQLAPAYRAVILFILTLGAIALALCAALVAHHGFTSTRRRRRTALMQRATPFLAAHLATGEKLRAGVVESRRTFGDWATAIVLREARRELRGERAAQITAALAEIGEVARLRRALQSRQEWRRVQVVRELGQCGGDEARDALLEATRDKAPEVRRAARVGLLADGRPPSIKAAIASYREDAPSGTTWRRSFYAQLAGASSADLRALLESGTLDREEEKLALEALGEARVPEALPLARERLTAPEPEIRATAARVVGKLADSASMPALSRLLSDSEWFVRAAAAKAFDSLPVDDASFKALGQCLSDQAWWVRTNAAHALAQQGDRGVETLLNAVEGTDAFSRDAGLAALGHAMMAPAARRRLQSTLSRLPDDSSAAPLRQLLESVPSGPLPVEPAGARA